MLKCSSFNSSYDNNCYFLKPYLPLVIVASAGTKILVGDRVVVVVVGAAVVVDAPNQSWDLKNFVFF